MEKRDYFRNMCRCNPRWSAVRCSFSLLCSYRQSSCSFSLDDSGKVAFADSSIDPTYLPITIRCRRNRAGSRTLSLRSLLSLAQWDRSRHLARSQTGCNLGMSHSKTATAFQSVPELLKWFSLRVFCSPHWYLSHWKVVVVRPEIDKYIRRSPC